MFEVEDDITGFRKIGRFCKTPYLTVNHHMNMTVSQHIRMMRTAKPTKYGRFCQLFLCPFTLMTKYLAKANHAANRLRWSRASDRCAPVGQTFAEMQNGTEISG